MTRWHGHNVEPRSASVHDGHRERAVATRPTRLAVTTLLAFTFAALFAQTGGRAQAGDALPFTKSFLLTGDYVISSVDLPRGGGTAPLPFNTTLGNAVPSNAVVVGAYLVWELLAPVGTPVVSASFRGLPISTAKATRIPPPLPSSGGSNCWGSSGGSDRALTAFRVDVLDLLPKHYDAANKWTGRYIVNDAELSANGLPQHTVTVGVPGSGNTLIAVGGATLALIYRIPPPSDGSPTAPLRKILLFDGASVQPLGATTTQTFRGFFKSAASNSSTPLAPETARWSMLVGSGARNLTETLTFNGTQLPVTNPIPDPAASGSDRGWAGLTFNVGALMPGAWDSNYGETVTVSIGHTNATPYECPSFSMMLFSVVIADDDNDGLPDGMEIPAASSGLRNPPTPAFPTGEPLPNVRAMGARVRVGDDPSGPFQPDAIIEVNAMVAPPGTKYGDSTAPYRDNLPSVTDEAGHDHIPPPEVIRMLGKGYADGGIWAHFDVGKLTEYFSRYPCPEDNAACHDDVIQYLVPSAHARGGERVLERACTDCQFKFFPGTMGYPFGLQGYRDAIVGENGEELIPSATQTLVQQLKAVDPEYPGVFRRRFDRVRQEYVRYLFVGHNRGRAKALLPCVKPDGSGAPYLVKNGEQTCGTGTKPNPLYNVPMPVSGVAALPGNHGLVTLGSWDPENFVGTIYGQAATIWHELGHTTNLWHFGPEPAWGDKATNQPTRAEQNCKPNLLTNMNYSYQLHGLPDDLGNLFLDYSRVPHDALSETGLNDAPLSEGGTLGARYRSAWFVPSTSPLALEQNATPARRFCSGVAFGGGQPAVPMARVTADTTNQTIDWDGNPATTSAASVDINFDGSASGVLRGFDEWANLRLNQIGASRHVRLVKKWTLSPSGQPVDAGDLIDFGSGDLIDFGSGDLIDFGSGDLIDFGSGTHIVDFNSGTFMQYGAGDLIDFGTGDLLDFGSGDLIDFGSGGLLNVGPQTTKPGNVNDGDGDLIDFGSGDLIDFGSGDLIDFGSGDLIDFGSGDLIDFGSGDLIDFGSGDLIDFGSGTQELDFDAAFGMERPRPLGLKGCVLGGTPAENGCDEPVPAGSLHRNKLSWSGPTFAVPSAYEVHRAVGAVSVLLATINAPDATTSPATTYIDVEELPNNVVARYWIKAKYGPNGSDGTSAKSNEVAINGVNYVPQAVNDPVPATDPAYITTTNTTLTVSVANGVLKNDTDVDSPIASRRLVRITQQPLYGTLTAQSNGSFVYVPFPGSYTGPDIFKYEVDNGLWPRNTNVPLNSVNQTLTEGTVTITIRPRGRR